MSPFPDSIQWNVAQYVDGLIDWLLANFQGVFDVIRLLILSFLMNVNSVLQWLPWWFVIGFVVVVGWRLQRNLLSGLIYGLLLVVIGSFGFWGLMMTTLAVVLTSVVISLAIGIPLGIFMAYNQIAEAILRPVLDAMQTMPSFVYLIPAMMFFRLGTVPAVFATTIYAVPPVIRLTNLAIRRVSKEMVEAGMSFGSSPMQLLFKVQLPQALPTIMTGINQTTMMALAMVVISSMIGAGGLGEEVLVAINQIRPGAGFEAGVSIVILAIIIDRMTQGFSQRFRTGS